jgi:MtN3 and saliva related transmembrane protein
MLAAALTSLSYLPQLQKAIPQNSTSDLSLKMLVALSAGLCLWVVYGVLKDDWVIMLANSIGATLSLAVLGFKIRDLNSRSRGLRQIFCSSVQPEKACDKEDDDDDADDVENVHCGLRVRHARFQHESTALQQETCWSASKFRRPRKPSGGKGGQFYTMGAPLIQVESSQ